MERVSPSLFCLLTLATDKSLNNFMKDKTIKLTALPGLVGDISPSLDTTLSARALEGGTRPFVAFGDTGEVGKIAGALPATLAFTSYFNSVMILAV